LDINKLQKYADQRIGRPPRAGKPPCRRSEPVERDLQVALAVRFRRRRFAGPDVHLDRRQHQFGQVEGGVPGAAHPHEFGLADPVARMLAAGALLGDKVYDSDDMIPSKSNRKELHEIDRETNKLRILIEWMSNKLKNWHRVATRYGKTAASFPQSPQSNSGCLWSVRPGIS